MNKNTVKELEVAVEGLFESLRDPWHPKAGGGWYCHGPTAPPRGMPLVPGLVSKTSHVRHREGALQRSFHVDSKEKVGLYSLRISALCQANPNEVSKSYKAPFQDIIK